MRANFLFFFIISFVSVYSQNVYFETITTKEGLSNNSINCIYNHLDGSLWIGTWDGLNLYDGKKIKVFKHNPIDSNSIAGNNIYQILKDKSNSFWILSDAKQISQFAGGDRFNNYSFESFPQNLSLDKNGNLLVKLDNYKIYKFINGEFSIINNAEANDNFIEPSIDKSSQEYIDTFIIQSISNKFSQFVIKAIVRQSKDNFWIATKDKGLFLVKKVNDDYVIIDNYQVDPQNPYSLLSNDLMTLHSDLFGNLWIATKDGGVSMLIDDRESIGYVYPHFIYQPLMSHESIRAITVDSNNGLWIGYYSQGVFYQEDISTPFKPVIFNKHTDDVNWSRIRSLYTDSNDNIWIGTYGGVVRINGEEQYFYDELTTANFVKNRTYDFKEDGNGLLWLGSWGGVSKYNLKLDRFETFINQHQLSIYNVRHITVHENHLILSTERHGIVFYNYISGEINIIDQNDGLLGNSVYSTCIDSFTGNIWISSLGGVTVLGDNKKVIKQLRENDGLPSHLVYSLIPYGNNIWISTTKGIASIDINNFNILDYSNYVGWQGIEFSEGAYFKNKNGVIYFGGNKGFNVLNPSKISSYQEDFNFKILLNGKNIAGQEMVEFPSYQRKIQFNIYPIGFGHYPLNLLEYRIDGQFEDWRVLPQKEFYLDNLSYGKYTIEVINRGQEENKIIYTQTFEILKPYYLRLPFIVLFLAVIIIVVIWGVMMKQNNLRKRELELKKQVKEQTLKVEFQKENLAKQNNQLNHLNIEMIKQQKELIELHSKFKNEDIEMENFRIFLLSKIKKPIISTLEILEELGVDSSKKKDIIHLYDMVLEWNYIEQIKDYDTKSTASINLYIFIECLKDEWFYLQQKYNIKINVISDIEEIWIELDLLRVKLLLRYLLNECYKYMEKNQVIAVNFMLEDNQLVVSINSDSNTLFTYWKANSTFSPYYRAFNILLQNLQGNVKNLSTEIFSLIIRLPITIIKKDDVSNKLYWDDLLQSVQVLPNDKYNMLVYSNDKNNALVQQILGYSTDYNLIYNHQVDQIVGNIEHYRFDALILYNIPLTDKLVLLFSKIKKNIQKQRLLVFYIAEEVDYFLQEQLAQLGVTDFIHLPVNMKIIDNKIYKRVQFDKENKNIKSLFWKSDKHAEVSVHLSSNEKMLRKGMDIMNNKFCDSTFSIEQLSNELGISKIKCYRLYKELLGQSPLEVLIEMRLHKAKLFIEKGDLFISEVCFECGFNDPKYFSKAFKKYYGYSPSHFKPY